LRVDDLFSSAPSLSAAIIASEIVQPPVALRPEGFSARANR